ncbi:MAG: methyltransferase domain-containing protein [Myxococcota bacterium]|nr:methyltransferase domain-containing protein [Myxococcota bacterium]
MKIGLFPERLIELAGIATGALPTPMGHTWCAQKLARWIMAAVKMGIFDALEAGPLDAPSVASRCGLQAHPTSRLLGVLVTADYVSFDSGKYALTPVSRKWLLKSGPTSLHDNILFQYLEWKLLDATEDFLRTGKPVDFHGVLHPDDWRVYQRGMRALAGTNAPEVVKRTPVPTGARKMLDIGGSHGFYSVALCRKHPRLSATILDLPQAVEHAAPILAHEEMGDRVLHRSGDARAEDLGDGVYDLVLISSLVHHFDDATNVELTRKCARALRPGGVLAIMDYLRLDSPNEGGQVAWLMNFYFALTSQSGAWSFEDIQRWQITAGLVPRKPVRFRTIPGSGLQAAMKTP